LFVRVVAKAPSVMSRHRLVKNINIRGIVPVLYLITSSFSGSIDELDDDALSDGGEDDEMTSEQHGMP
jgi:hypothetical protein